MSESQAPADRSQLWSNSAFNPGDAALRHAAAAEEARRALFGASDDDFARRQAESNLFYSQRQASEAEFAGRLYQENQAFIDRHNEPILASIRAAEEVRTTKLMTDVAMGMATVAGASAVLGAAADGPLAEPPAAPSLPSRFADTIMPRRGEMSSFEPSATGVFNARAIVPENLSLGLGSAMAFTQSLMPAPGYASIPDAVPATTNPIEPGAAAPAATAPAEPAAPMTRPMAPRTNNAFMLELDLANGPKPPTWVTAKSNSSGTPAS